MFAAKVAEVGRHAQAKQHASQARGAEHEPQRHALGRPHEEPHKDAPEQAEEAAHEQSDGPETHEERWRKINAQAPQKPPERRGRSVWRYTKCPEVLLHSFQLVGICHARLTLELSGAGTASAGTIG